MAADRGCCVGSKMMIEDDGLVLELLFDKIR